MSLETVQPVGLYKQPEAEIEINALAGLTLMAINIRLPEYIQCIIVSHVHVLFSPTISSYV